jgi:hypothetical protein
MIRQWKWFWVALWSLLIGSVFTRNMFKYKDQPIWWNLGKSLLDTIVIVLSALFLPPFLIATDVAWIISFAKKKWLKITIGIASSVILGVVSAYAMEVVILLGIFGVDAKTGPDKGFIHRWRQVQHEELTGERVAA